jgi:uncharacterized coiled-coil protein SlyX
MAEKPVVVAYLPASAASVRELSGVAQAAKVVDDMYQQIDAMMPKIREVQEDIIARHKAMEPQPQPQP